MKKKIKLVFVLFFLSTLIACSNTEAKETNDKNNEKEVTQILNFEQKIQETLKHNNIEVDTIIDYDIKDNYIFVVYYEISMNPLSISFMKLEQDNLHLVMTEHLQSETTVIGDESTPFVTVVKVEHSNVKEVRVFDKPAKFVKLNKNAGDDISLEIKYWIAYSDSQPEMANDIIIIEE